MEWDERYTFLKTIYDPTATGNPIDLDSIEGNFVDIVLPALLENGDLQVEAKGGSTIISDLNLDGPNSEAFGLSSDILSEILFKRERSIAAWKDFIVSLSVPDKKPSKCDILDNLFAYLKQATNQTIHKALPLLLAAFLNQSSNFTKKNIVPNFGLVFATLKIIVEQLKSSQ